MRRDVRRDIKTSQDYWGLGLYFSCLIFRNPLVLITNYKLTNRDYAYDFRLPTANLKHSK
jgi:hypothetical protein